MKPKIVFVALLGAAFGLAGGVMLERHFHTPDAPSRGSGDGRRILYWGDPMLPDYRSDRPGKSPMGMDLVPVYEGQHANKSDDRGTVSVSPAVIQNLGMRSAAVERMTLVPAIETFGLVAYDGNRTAHVHVRGTGWVEKLYTRVAGEAVERGQLLLEVFSPPLIIAAFEFVREIQHGGGDMAEGARRKLVALGVSDQQIDEIRKSAAAPDHIKVYAPRSGVVDAIGVTEGMYVDPNATLLSIIDPDSVWVMTDVFESQAALVFPGMTAEVRVASQPGRVWKGTVDYVYPDLKPDTRTLQLRVRLDNPSRALKPNMFASVRLGTRPHDGVLAVPSEAVIRTGQGERVVLALGDGRFKPMAVTAGITVGEKTEIAVGLKEGDRVVTSAQFLIDSESSLNTGLARMQDADTPAADAKTPSATGEGEVKAVVASGGKITVSHGPIGALSWPAMTMSFGVQPGVSLADILPGERIRFGVALSPDGMANLTSIERIGGAGRAP